ncbi:tRNA lysidine(34) synthetase TilS [Marinobacter salinisoli]|uniref:tRNA(Ile)-lysidine synthase n=1 Tax=Marinobacter salinisoli TaxID=2769486 RepID=A0ABX7MPL1_9GAMM|nr:tRNA lysidine(34) synthetase TilS [Marinobacter salinisoli]QSP94252.1 tRNA lysidine(34) synthetase TilS [Marinobacter salinisoli]
MTTGGKPGSGFAWPDALCCAVRSLPQHSRLWVALSGGLDSMVLLHLATACHQGRVALAAVHINHQLQANAGEAEALCRAVCEELEVPLEVRRVTVDASCESTPAGGIEEAARDARYAEFDQILAPGDLLLMAHHADDQAETVLFRLLRGTGVAGLAGMPVHRPLGRGHLFRPLLAFGRAELERCARAAALSWVEDPSNTDRVFDRNYLRHEVMPGLKSRWPTVIQRVERSAEACAESTFLNQRLAEKQWLELGDQQGRVDLAGFRTLSLAEQKNLIRWWVDRQGYAPLTVSGWRQLIHDLTEAAEDRAPVIEGRGFSLRRFRSKLYLIPDRPAPPSGPVFLVPGQTLPWGWWTLRLESVLTPQPPLPPIRVSTRQGGERVPMSASEHSKSLKNWFQEQAVPPWERACLPLVFVGSGAAEQLIAVGDFWCSGQYSGGAPAAGWRLVVGRDCD